MKRSVKKKWNYRSYLGVSNSIRVKLVISTVFVFLSVCCAEDPGIVAEFMQDVAGLTNYIPLVFPHYPHAEYSDPRQNEIYDFIIVGAGPSGSVLANRLSEVPKWNVLLLEAGTEATPLVEVPTLCVYPQFSEFTWGYNTQRQKHFCTGCIDNVMRYPRGKGLGGTSLINFMIYVRGNPMDYERWASMGNPGWAYEDVLPYFKKIENDHVELGDPGYKSKRGYLDVGDVPFKTKLVGAFVEAAREAGYPYVDYNGKRQMGVSYVQGTIRDGARCSAEKAYLRPARDRKNLKVHLRAQVTRILIDSSNVAQGVEYFRDGEYYLAYARKEVIISAGVLNSPQLLMLSGIGPEKHLKNLGIPVRVNLPVGQKMYDHPIFVGIIYQLNESVAIDAFKAFTDINSYKKWFLEGTGVLASLGGIESLIYFRSNNSDEDTSYPNIELLSVSGSLATDRGWFYRRMFNVPWEAYEEVWRPLENTTTYQVYPVLLHPKSYGYLKLNSANPFEPPLLYANYFSDPENYDIKTFISSIREIERINDQSALKRYGAKLVSTKLPGCKKHIFDTDEYWECALRSLIGSLFHQTSTCKMGPISDPEAVVDASLRVYGVKNLMVADVSIIPIRPTAHTVAMAYLVGEKAADIVKKNWRN